jgi:hypothetical protein
VDAEGAVISTGFEVLSTKILDCDREKPEEGSTNERLLSDADFATNDLPTRDPVQLVSGAELVQRLHEKRGRDWALVGRREHGREDG